MDKNLYPDFKLTLENCDTEPINRPIAIQGHGHMMVFDEENPDHLYAMSDQVKKIFNIHEEKLWQTSPKDWMPPALFKVFEEMKKPERWNSNDPVPFVFNGNSWNIIRHIHQKKWFIEMEPQKGTNNDQISASQMIRLVTEPLYHIDTEKELFQQLAKQFKKVSGYDRVMVYQFDKDYHGHVVGESKEKHLESFLGLHYPATDIPKIARDLFLLNRSRIISNIHLPNYWLHFNPDIKQTVPYLYLTYSQLRATSPIHIEYLTNMGVVATLILAIIVEGKLWGLISCHHYSPYFLPFEKRKTGEIITNLFALKYLEVLKSNTERESQIYLHRENKFLSQINIDQDISIQLIDATENIQNLFEADGAALLTSNFGTSVINESPAAQELEQIRDWLVENQKTVFFTDNLSEELPGHINIPEQIGGMIAIKISQATYDYLFWFRYTQTQTTTWGGNPDVPYEVEEVAGEIRLSPRKSFEKWKMQIGTRSMPWNNFDLALAKRVQENLLTKETKRQAFKALQIQNEFEQLTYITSHDLQEPLRTVTNYLELLKEELQDNYSGDIKFFMERTNLATTRMRAMIKDLLDYSRIGSDKENSWIDIEKIIQETTDDLNALINETQTKIKAGKLPFMKGSETDIKQLFQNLISNAIKYRKSNRKPIIIISAKHTKTYWNFAIKDNGIGIAQENFDKIFMLFHRLHRKDEHEGTGIGLTQCKKIVETAGGKIWVNSTQGKGSTFFFRIHESRIRNHV